MNSVREESNIILLANVKSHIDFLSSYIKDKGGNPIVFEMKNINDIDYDAIEEFQNKNYYSGILVSSEIDSFKTRNLPDFLKRLRQVVGNKPVVFFHPSKVHPEDRDLIMKSIKEPFKALQGHDLDQDPVEDLDFVLKGFLI